MHFVPSKSVNTSTVRWNSKAKAVNVLYSYRLIVYFDSFRTKSGNGRFLYENKKAKGARPVNQAAMDIVKRYAVEPRGFGGVSDIQLRVASRFINNKAILCLQEGILPSPVCLNNPSSCYSFFFLAESGLSPQPLIVLKNVH
jgi:hypothetical protein